MRIAMGRLAVPSVVHAQVQRWWVSVRSAFPGLLIRARGSSIAGAGWCWLARARCGNARLPCESGLQIFALYFVIRVIGIDWKDRV